MPITEERYIQLALEDPEGRWELVDGCPRKKPTMTWEHNHTGRRLMTALVRQLDDAVYEVAVDHGRVQRSARNYFIPDVYVIPVALARQLFTRQGMLEAYPEPLPLVVEIWSPATGDYDQHDKLDEYRRRGDHEVWLIHSYEHWLTAWRRQADGSYQATTYHHGLVQQTTLPNVTIDLDDLLKPVLG